MNRLVAPGLLSPDHRQFREWSLIVAVSDERVLSQTLLKSPAIDERCQVITKPGFECAGTAYNAGIAEAANEIMVFAHQDMYLPKRWLCDLSEALDHLGKRDPNWGVLGAFGITICQEPNGFVYSTGLRATLGMTFPGAIQATTLDEMILIVRRSSGLLFDERLPGFHLYGTDLCMQAKKNNMNSYIISAFCIHNSNGIRHLPAAFWRSYFYLRRKWWNDLPLKTCCTTITKWCLPVARSVASDLGGLVRGPKVVGKRCEDPELLYGRLEQELGLAHPPLASGGRETTEVNSSSSRLSTRTTASSRMIAGRAMAGTRSSPRISVLGATFNTNNLGVSALTEGTIRAVLHCFPEASIFLLDYGREGFTETFQLGDRDVRIPFVNMRFSKKFYLPNNIAVLLLLAFALKLIPFRGVRQRLISGNHCLQHIYETDLFLSLAGGDSFSDTYGLGRLLYVALPQILALLCGKKLVLMPQTLGPFSGALSRVIARFILNHADVVYSRERAGLKEAEPFLAANHNRRKLRFCYDLGFLVEPRPPAKLDVVGLPAKREDGSPLVGFNVSGLLAVGGYMRDNMFGLKVGYLELVEGLVDFLIQEKKATVLLVPHVFGGPESEESDSAVCESIYEKLKTRYKGRIGFVRSSHNQNEIKYIIGQCDFFLGSRMHACIAALSQNIPAVAIAYSDKFVGVLETIGVDFLVVDPRKMDKQELIHMVGQAYDQRNSVRRHLESKIPQVREGALNLFADLQDLCSVA